MEKILQAKYNDLFTNVPPSSKFDQECIEGYMKFLFNNSSSTRTHLKRETPAPSPIPASSSPGQTSARAYSIPASTLADEIPEHRLIIGFSRQNSLETLPIQVSPESLVARNPSMSEISAIRLKDVTKAAMIEVLIHARSTHPPTPLEVYLFILNTR